MWQVMGNVIGDDFDGKNTLDIGDIGFNIESLYDGGFESFDEFYNFVLQENFINENSANHGYYMEVLEAYNSAVA